MLKLKKLFFRVIPSVIGELTLTYDEKSIIALEFGYKSSYMANGSRSLLSEAAELQLNEYFSGKRELFDLPLAPTGTDFQKKVWNTVRLIPYADFDTYTGIAEKVGSPKASRAVGLALHKNPIPIIIPCHRVIGASGLLTGYSGGLKVKKFLTDGEATHFNEK